MAGDWIGLDHDGWRRVDRAFAHPVNPVGGRVRAGINRVAAGRGCCNFSDQPASGASTNSSRARRRESGQRCDRAGGPPICSGRADDGNIFARPGYRTFRHRRARRHRSWSGNRVYRALDASTPR